MSTTSSTICAAADALQGLVGYNAKSGHHIVRFSEDSFGLDVTEDSIQPCAEFVWQPLKGALMTLSRERLGSASGAAHRRAPEHHRAPAPVPEAP